MSSRGSQSTSVCRERHSLVGGRREECVLTSLHLAGRTTSGCDWCDWARDIWDQACRTQPSLHSETLHVKRSAICTNTEHRKKKKTTTTIMTTPFLTKCQFAVSPAVFQSNTTFSVLHALYSMITTTNLNRTYPRWLDQGAFSGTWV